MGGWVVTRDWMLWDTEKFLELAMNQNMIPQLSSL
jgi:hypothetical protein